MLTVFRVKKLELSDLFVEMLFNVMSCIMINI